MIMLDHAARLAVGCGTVELAVGSRLARQYLTFFLYWHESEQKYCQGQSAVRSYHRDHAFSLPRVS